jgi:hypothetical protein
MLDVRREETSVDRSDGEINAICCGGWRDKQDRVGVLGREGERERVVGESSEGMGRVCDLIDGPQDGLW